MDEQEVAQLGENEVVIRFQDGQGIMRAFIMDGDVVADRARAVYPDLTTLFPPMIRTLIDGFFFGLRHGPLQKLLKAKGIDGAFDKTFPHKDAEALAAIFKLMVKDIQQKNEEMYGNRYAPVDLTQQDIATVYRGAVRRAPEFDGMALDAGMEPTKAIPEPDQESFDYAEPTSGS